MLHNQHWNDAFWRHQAIGSTNIKLYLWLGLQQRLFSDEKSKYTIPTEKLLSKWYLIFPGIHKVEQKVK